MGGGQISRNILRNLTGLAEARNFEKFTVLLLGVTAQSTHSPQQSVPRPLSSLCCATPTPAAQPTVRLLIRNISAVWMMSASVSICWSPNMALSMEKTRSAAAELGVKAKTICATSAHAATA